MHHAKIYGYRTSSRAATPVALWRSGSSAYAGQYAG